MLRKSHRLWLLRLLYLRSFRSVTPHDDKLAGSSRSANLYRPFRRCPLQVFNLDVCISVSLSRSGSSSRTAIFVSSPRTFDGGCHGIREAKRNTTSASFTMFRVIAAVQRMSAWKIQIDGTAAFNHGVRRGTLRSRQSPHNFRTFVSIMSLPFSSIA